MKQKISITLSSELLEKIDKEAGSKASRSAFLENVLREHYRQKLREAIDRRDLEIINANAEYLNREMEDVLRYQAPIEYSEEDN